jgi:broad specificity phosphatase PhoE
VIRHGQSLENIGRAQTPNCGLSELGRLQAGRLAAFFERIPLAAVFSSHFRRVIQTAMPTVLPKEPA